MARRRRAAAGPGEVFLPGVGQAGGAAALYETMVTLGMINKPPAWAGPPRMPAGHGQGKSVLILGAGIGGLTAAYVLSQSAFVAFPAGSPGLTGRTGRGS